MQFCFFAFLFSGNLKKNQKNKKTNKPKKTRGRKYFLPWLKNVFPFSWPDGSWECGRNGPVAAASSVIAAFLGGFATSGNNSLPGCREGAVCHWLPVMSLPSLRFFPAFFSSPWCGRQQIILVPCLCVSFFGFWFAITISCDSLFDEGNAAASRLGNETSAQSWGRE